MLLADAHAGRPYPMPAGRSQGAFLTPCATRSTIRAMTACCVSSDVFHVYARCPLKTGLLFGITRSPHGNTANTKFNYSQLPYPRSHDVSLAQRNDCLPYRRIDNIARAVRRLPSCEFFRNRPDLNSCLPSHSLLPAALHIAHEPYVISQKPVSHPSARLGRPHRSPSHLNAPCSMAFPKRSLHSAIYHLMTPMHL